MVFPNAVVLKGVLPITSCSREALPNPVTKRGHASHSAYKFACWQLVLPQRPVPSLQPFPRPLVHFWNVHRSPLGVESGLEQIHL